MPVSQQRHRKGSRERQPTFDIGDPEIDAFRNALRTFKKLCPNAPEDIGFMMHTLAEQAFRWKDGAASFVPVSKTRLVAEYIKEVPADGPFVSDDDVQFSHEDADRVLSVLAERGMIKIDGELWQARSADGEHLRPGERVEVESRDGLMLTVRPV